MLGEPYLGILFGFILSLLTSIVSIILSNRITEKRETRKTKMEEEKKAILEIYSPLVFLLEKSRDLFIKILSLKKALDEVNEKEIVKTEVDVRIFLVILFRDVYTYSETLKKLLINKLGIVKPRGVYKDLILYQSYLGTIAEYCHSLQWKKMKIITLKEVLDFFVPILSKLEEATAHLREMALARTMGLKNYKYKTFFTETVYSDLEKKIESLHIKMYGSRIPEWGKLFIEDSKDLREK